MVILLVDDSVEDRLFITHALNKSDINHVLRAVSDGEQAISYLKGEGEYDDRSRYPFPTLLLCDLKMPRKDGFEVLEWLQQNRPPAQGMPRPPYQPSTIH